MVQERQNAIKRASVRSNCYLCKNIGTWGFNLNNMQESKGDEFHVHSQGHSDEMHRSRELNPVFASLVTTRNAVLPLNYYGEEQLCRTQGLAI